MRKFFLRTKNEKGYATLFTRIRKRSPKVDILASSLIQVDIETWEKANRSLDDWNRFTKTRDGEELAEKLEKVSKAIESLTKQGIFDKKLMEEAISNAVYAEERQAAREKEEQERKAKEEQEAARRADVMRYVSEFVEGMESGRRRNGADRYAVNSVRAWRYYRAVLQKFIADEASPLAWSDIDRNLIDRFRDWLEAKGYMKKSINLFLALLRATVSFALRDGLHDNATALHCFRLATVKEADKRKEIYLTGAELNALYEMPLEGLKSVVRDVFLVGCYTCQRFSDYSRLERENFTTTARGTKVVRLVQEKTGSAIVVPILNNNLVTIAERYGYEIPRVSNAVLNKCIKEILRELSESVPSLAAQERTKLTMDERAKEERGEVTFSRDEKGYPVRPRYELVGSHTARRSGITNLYLSGKFDDVQMMAVSGHRDSRTFREYIKLSGDEIADAIAQKAESDRTNLF